MNKWRQELLQAIEENLLSRHQLITREIASLEASAGGEQKSSAGDKHETSREMMRQELDILFRNLHEIELELQELSFLKNFKQGDCIRHGTFLESESAFYLIARITGKFEINKKQVIAVSPDSPFAQEILGLQPNDRFHFRALNGSIMALHG